MTGEAPYTLPKEPGRWRALALAALVHLALLAFLWVGIRWQNETPATIEAEVWSPDVREAAPAPEPVQREEPKPQPTPQPQPVAKEVPKPKVEEPPVVKPDIALEQEKKRKAEEKKRLEERLEQERLAREKKRLEEEKEKLAQEKKRQEEEKLAKLKLKQQEEAKRLEQEKLEKAKKEAAEKKKREQEEAVLAKMREEDMRRITGSVAGTGGTGEARQSQGGRASSEYAGRVGAKIRSNTIFNVTADMTGNPAVEYQVDLLPDGSLRGSPRKLKSSGIAAFDEAVLRAIEKSQPFPRDTKTGAVPSSFIVSHRPKDQ